MADRNQFPPYSRPPSHQQYAEQHKRQESLTEEGKEFDLFDTAQTVIETYRQLSPYVKQLSKLVKKKGN